jgi:8-oxo-dGTP diphosphatase
MAEEKERPCIGIGVIIRKNGKVLLGKRQSSHGKGTWSYPGGHLEKWETIEGCAEREAFEESGLKIRNNRNGPFTNDFFETEGKHYVTLCVVADWESGEPVVKEPEKTSAWQWFSWTKLPKPLFLPCENLVKTGFDPFHFKE